MSFQKAVKYRSRSQAFVVETNIDPGGKVRAISRGVLARGDIARDPARSRQIPWFRVRLRKGVKRRDYARSRVHIINARVSHPG